MAPDSCPQCGKILDEAWRPAPPVAGEYLACEACSTILRFGKDLRLRLMASNQDFAGLWDRQWLIPM
jgi:hypothetical protein